MHLYFIICYCHKDTYKFLYISIDAPQIERTLEQERLELMREDPKINNKDLPPDYVKIAAQLGHQLSIECRASGVPDAKIGWQKHYKPPKPDLNRDNGGNGDGSWNADDPRDSFGIRNEGKTDGQGISSGMKYRYKWTASHKREKDYPISAYKEVDILKYFYIIFASK